MCSRKSGVKREKSVRVIKYKSHTRNFHDYSDKIYAVDRP